MTYYQLDSNFYDRKSNTNESLYVFQGSIQEILREKREKLDRKFQRTHQQRTSSRDIFDNVK